MENLKILRNVISVIFCTSTIMLSGLAFLERGYYLIFLYLTRESLLSIRDPYWTAIFFSQLASLITVSLVLTIDSIRQPTTTPYRIFNYFSAIIILLIVCDTLFLFFGFFLNFPIPLLVVLANLLPLLFVLSNLIIAYIVLKSKINKSTLFFSFWTLSIVVFGMMLYVFDTFVKGFSVWNISEKEMATFPVSGWIEREVFLPGNQHFWLLLGMSLVILFGLLGIWLYIKGMIAVLKNRQLAER